MNTSAPTQESRRNVALFSMGSLGFNPEVYKKDNGNLVVQDMPVFRSGTFKDSMGYSHAWESIHMDQMVTHFDMLRNRGVFTDVPVRNGHPFFGMALPGAGEVIGYHTGLTVQERTNKIDGKDYSYLLANYEILDDTAKSKINSGLFRNRSSEVGEYETNSESLFWPVYFGFAYVDIPAVEGLNGFSMNGFTQATQDRKFIVMLEKEIPVADKNDKDEGQGQPQSPAAAPSPSGPQLPSQHGAPDNVSQLPPQQPHSFTINGQSVTDYSQVQAHIASLEQFRTETNENARKDFVSQLARDNKILAPQTETLQAFALTLDDTQFSAWKASWDAAPASSLTANHSVGDGQPQTPPEDAADKKLADEIAIAEQTVQMHRNAGMAEDQLEKTQSYKRLQTLRAQAAK